MAMAMDNNHDASSNGSNSRPATPTHTKLTDHMYANRVINSKHQKSQNTTYNDLYSPNYDSPNKSTSFQFLNAPEPWNNLQINDMYIQTQNHPNTPNPKSNTPEN